MNASVRETLQDKLSQLKEELAGYERRIPNQAKELKTSREIKRDLEIEIKEFEKALA